MNKSPFKSWTLWINVLGAAAVGALTQIDIVSDAGWIAVVMAGANFLLRFKTTQPIV